MTIAGLILAAGISRRMGQPKALLRYRGETFLDRMIGMLSTCCDEVIVVAGHRGEELRASLDHDWAARFVTNPDPSRGQLSSLQTGLAATGADAVIFTPVDYPAVLPSTVATLAEALGGGAPLVIPSYRGRHGHPVGIARALAVEILELAGGCSARDAIQRHNALYLDVDDPGILLDVDTPADYRDLTGRHRFEEE